jgi:hypothetical protein
MKEHSQLPEEGADKLRTANQLNSSSSCEPNPPEAKRSSSMNSLKYGFFSKKALLPSESWDEFEVFHDTLLGQLSPRNQLERHLAETYIVIEWRLRRLPEIEAGMFARYNISAQGNQCGAAFSWVNSIQSDDVLNQLARYEATLRRNSLKYLDMLRTFRKDGWGGDAKTIVEIQTVDISPASGDASGRQRGSSPAGEQTSPSPR